MMTDICIFYSYTMCKQWFFFDECGKGTSYCCLLKQERFHWSVEAVCVLSSTCTTTPPNSFLLGDVCHPQNPLVHSIIPASHYPERRPYYISATSLTDDPVLFSPDWRLWTNTSGVLLSICSTTTLSPMLFRVWFFYIRLFYALCLRGLFYDNYIPSTTTPMISL